MIQGFESDVFYPVAASELFHHQLGVGLKVDIGGTQFKGFFQCHNDGNVFCLVVGGEADSVGNLSDDFIVFVPDNSPCGGRAWITACGAIGVDCYFHRIR